MRERRCKVRRVHTVDHVVDGIVTRRFIGPMNGFVESGPRGEFAVGLRRKRDRDRHTCFHCRAHDADRLFDVVHRKGGDHVDIGLREDSHLSRMICLGFLDGHLSAGTIAIAART